MCTPHLSRDALNLLDKATQDHGMLSIQLRSERGNNRFVMELLVAGRLRPLALQQGGTDERIVYAATDLHRR